MTSWLLSTIKYYYFKLNLFSYLSFYSCNILYRCKHFISIISWILHICKFKSIFWLFSLLTKFLFSHPQISPEPEEGSQLLSSSSVKKTKKTIVINYLIIFIKWNDKIVPFQFIYQWVKRGRGCRAAMSPAKWPPDTQRFCRSFRGAHGGPTPPPSFFA